MPSFSLDEVTFKTSWVEFMQSLEDVLVMFRLPTLANEGAMDLVLFEGENEKVRLLSAALKISNKST